MDELERPQSESVEEILDEQGNPTTPAPITEVDLGDGTKLSIDDIKQLHSWHSNYGDVDEINLKEAKELKAWVAKNPDQYQKILEIVRNKPANEQKPNPLESRMDEQQQILDQIILDKQMNDAKSWSEVQGVKWSKELEIKILQHISKTNDEPLKAAKLVLFDVLRKIDSRKSVNKTKAQTEGGSSSSLPGPKDTKDMSSEERRNAMLRDAKHMLGT